MMLPFFLLILLDLPWVDTTVNNTSRLDNSTSGLDNALEARQWVAHMRCKECTATNTFYCSDYNDCPLNVRRCMTIAVRVSIRKLFVLKSCTQDCSFVYKEHEPPPLPRVLKDVKGFYFVLCCGSVLCNDGGPNNIERDLLPESSIEEEEIAGAVRLGRFNLLLCLALILSISIYVS